MSRPMLSLALGLLLQVVRGLEYTLIQNYNASNFFDGFTFFTGQDPTGGFVDFLSYELALNKSLIDNISDVVYLAVDHTNVISLDGPGRPSVRLESKMTFTEGLFVLDLLHLPVGCGTWPAFWTVGLGDWPANGEIDIIEGVNDATGNDASLHAAGECTVSKDVDQTGKWKSTDCNIGHDKNQGCGTTFTEPYNFGPDFNTNGGGVYAMEWTNSSINIWFFSPENVPESLFSPSPDTNDFGIPGASFSGPCSDSFAQKFFNHTLIIDTTFCGGWGGGTFGTGEETQCPLVDSAGPDASCKSFVAMNPQAFNETYWAIKSLTIWQKVLGIEQQFIAAQNTSLTMKNTTLQAAVQSTVTVASVSTPTIDSEAKDNEDLDDETVESTEEEGEDEDDEDLSTISPLTGGLLTSGEAGKTPPVIDPGIGDGTIPNTMTPVVNQPTPGEVSSPSLIGLDGTSDQFLPAVPGTAPGPLLPSTAQDIGPAGQAPPAFGQSERLDIPSNVVPAVTNQVPDDNSDTALTQGVLRLIPRLLDAIAKLTGLTSHDVLDQLATLMGNLPNDLQQLPLVMKLLPMLLFLKTILPVQVGKRQTPPLPIDDLAGVSYTAPEIVAPSFDVSEPTEGVPPVVSGSASELPSTPVGDVGAGQIWSSIPADVQSQLATIENSLNLGNPLSVSVTDKPPSVAESDGIGVAESSAQASAQGPILAAADQASPDVLAAKVPPLDTADTRLGIGSIISALDPETQSQLFSVINWSALIGAGGQPKIKRRLDPDDAGELHKVKRDWSHHKPSHTRHYPQSRPWGRPSRPYWPHKPSGPWSKPTRPGDIDYEDFKKLIGHHKTQQGNLNNFGKKAVVLALQSGLIKESTSPSDLQRLAHKFDLSFRDVTQFAESDIFRWLGTDAEQAGASSLSDSESEDSPYASADEMPDGLDDPDTDWPYLARRAPQDDYNGDDDDWLDGLDVTYDSDGGQSFAFITDFYDPKAAWYAMDEYARKQYLELLKEYGYIPKHEDVSKTTKDLWHWLHLLKHLGDLAHEKRGTVTPPDDAAYGGDEPSELGTKDFGGLLDFQKKGKGLDLSDHLASMWDVILKWLKQHKDNSSKTESVEDESTKDGATCDVTADDSTKDDTSSLWRTSYHQTEPREGGDASDYNSPTANRQDLAHPQPEVTSDMPEVPSFYDYEDDTGPGNENWYEELAGQLGENDEDDDGGEGSYDDSYIPQHADENAGSGDGYEAAERTENSKPWTKFIEALKISPVKQSEVNGPATGEMVKDEDDAI